MLSPPTFPALREALERQERSQQEHSQQYHVVHFDGHGVYNRNIGLGGLCFEDPQDAGFYTTAGKTEKMGKTGKLRNRRHQTIYTKELGELLYQYRIPLVFLEACQTAMSDEASESVASELLKGGVASVVAMSHSVLVETARRFVQVFYRELTEGARVGAAMLAGQRTLKDDNFRGHIFGAGELRLADWFVPVLFQEKADPQLFVKTLQPQAQADVLAALQVQLDRLPNAPPSGFIGRSRYLLAMERLLIGGSLCGKSDSLQGDYLQGEHPYAVVRGQGGEGKTAIAAEFSRWMLRSRQIRQVAFVSVEQSQNVDAVLDALGQQLLNNYSVAEHSDLDQKLMPVERALKEQSTLLVVDNMESILLPPFVKDSTPEALKEDARAELDDILALCAQLNKMGETRIIFTSRELLPAPFDNKNYVIELQQLDRIDAIKLVERTLNIERRLNVERTLNIERAVGPDSAGGDSNQIKSLEATARADIEELVDAVNCHARTLTLLAPSLQSLGVKSTTDKMAQLMSDMQGNREQSLFASVALSLDRLSLANRERVKVLRLFHGGIHLGVLKAMMGWDDEVAGSLAQELVATGLATANQYSHLSLNAALCPFLLKELNDAGLKQLDEGLNKDLLEPENQAEGQSENQAESQSEKQNQTATHELEQFWLEAMVGYVNFLGQQARTDPQMTSALTLLDLPNLFALLEQLAQLDDAETTIGFCTSLYGLIQNLGKPRLLPRVADVRDAAEKKLQTQQGNSWSHARFQVQRIRIEQQLQAGQLQDAFNGAQRLLEQAKLAGATAYDVADYDLAMAYLLLGRVMNFGGAAMQAMELLSESFNRFEAIAREQKSKSDKRLAAERMTFVCLTELGDCLLTLGRYEEAVSAYEESIERTEKSEDKRQIAVGKMQLGTIRLQQKQYGQALEAYQESREGFEQLEEPGSVAAVLHQTGSVYQEMQEPEAAEAAYRQSLTIEVQLGDVVGQANSLGQLSNLYEQLGRAEEAVVLMRQASDKYVEIGDVAGEGRCHNNLANLLRRLDHLDEARQAIKRAIECKSSFGHAAEPWKSWSILCNIETDMGNDSAAKDARQNAFDCYLAYRQDGGENHNGTGRLAHNITQILLVGDSSKAVDLLQETEAQYHEAGCGIFHQALQAIVNGSREQSLADNIELHYRFAAEIVIMLETLQAAGI